MLLVNGNVEPVATFLKHQSETGRDEQGLAVHWFVTTPMAQLLEMLATVDDKTDQDYRSVHQWLEEHALSEWITKLNTQEGVLPSTQTLRLQLLGSRGECVATPMPHNHHAVRKWAQRFRMKHKLRIAKLDVHGGGRIEETRDKAPVIEPEKWFPRVEIVVQFCGPANSSQSGPPAVVEHKRVADSGPGKCAANSNIRTPFVWLANRQWPDGKCGTMCIHRQPAPIREY